jgi:hypothetical protein
MGAAQSGRIGIGTVISLLFLNVFIELGLPASMA